MNHLDKIYNLSKQIAKDIEHLSEDEKDDIIFDYMRTFQKCMQNELGIPNEDSINLKLEQLKALLK